MICAGTGLPLRIAGRKRMRSTAFAAAWSSPLPGPESTFTARTCPVSSTSTERTTVPSMPRLRASSG